MMLRLIPHALLVSLGALVRGQTEEPAGRAYVVLEKQNLVTLGSVLGALLLLMVFMAVCVYKPLPRS